MRLAILLLTLILCAASALSGSTSDYSQMNNSIESDLKVILETRKIPPELSIMYNDLHGLWGGTRITITGTESGEIQVRDSGEPEPQIHKSKVEQDQLLELVKLVVDLKAWEQRTPEREPAPDESRSYLTINTGAHSSMTWEWFNDMEKDQRLIQIKTKMTGMVKKK